jgi:hypothetical protein
VRQQEYRKAEETAKELERKYSEMVRSLAAVNAGPLKIPFASRKRKKQLQSSGSDARHAEDLAMQLEKERLSTERSVRQEEQQRPSSARLRLQRSFDDALRQRLDEERRQAASVAAEQLRQAVQEREQVLEKIFRQDLEAGIDRERGLRRLKRQDTRRVRGKVEGGARRGTAPRG